MTTGNVVALVGYMSESLRSNAPRWTGASGRLPAAVSKAIIGGSSEGFQRSVDPNLFVQSIRPGLINAWSSIKSSAAVPVASQELNEELLQRRPRASATP